MQFGPCATHPMQTPRVFDTPRVRGPNVGGASGPSGDSMGILEQLVSVLRDGQAKPKPLRLDKIKVEPFFGDESAWADFKVSVCAQCDAAHAGTQVVVGELVELVR